MKIKESPSRKAFNIFNVLFMCALMAVTLYPMLYVVFASFSESGMLMAKEGVLLKPEGFSIAAYKAVFKNPNIISGYKNTLFVIVIGTTLNVFLTSLAAYVLSRKNFLLNGPITLMIVVTMFFGGGLIPTYLVVEGLGLTDTFLALILPTAMSTYNMIIMRTGFAAIPDSLEESAKIDGARHFTILWKIVFPLAKPTIAVIFLYYCVAHWNSWFNAMIYLPRRTDLQPLQLVLRKILLENDTASMTASGGATDLESISETVKYAVIVVSTLPILAMYPFIQKYFVKGIMIGAVKG